MWNVFTPQLKASIVFVAGPLTLLVALWGMTGEYALQLMRRSTTGSQLQALAR